MYERTKSTDLAFMCRRDIHDQFNGSAHTHTETGSFGE
jgi:hypothetical protein